MTAVSVATRMKILSYQPEAEELAEYAQNMAWLAVCKKGFYEWYNNKRKDKTLTEDGRKVCHCPTVCIGLLLSQAELQINLHTAVDLTRYYINLVLLTRLSSKTASSRWQVDKKALTYHINL